MRKAGTVVRSRSNEPWWARHVGFAAVVVVSLVAVLVTRSPLALVAVVTAYTALLRSVRR